MTEMTDIYHLTLLPNTDEAAFKAFAEQTGFSLASLTRAGEATSQYLLKEHDSDGNEDRTRRYVWIVHWTLFFGMEALREIDPSLWKVQGQIESQAEITSYVRYIQVAVSPPPDGNSANS